MTLLKKDSYTCFGRNLVSKCGIRVADSIMGVTNSGKSAVRLQESPLAHLLRSHEEQPRAFCRHLSKMKSRTTLFVFLGLLILTLDGILLYFASPRQEPAQVFPASVSRDCAPWDGVAFTISIPYDPVTVIYISIWQSPDTRFPSTFSFPDETGRLGNAYILHEQDPLTPLHGEISLQRVEQGMPLEGRFRFTSE